VDVTLDSLQAAAAPATWVLSSHDETRHATRFGRAETRASIMGFDIDPTTDRVLGERRARAAALLQLALPGIASLYQGDELGLPEVTDLPEEVLQDPIWERSGRTSRGRDGCRVPLPWAGTEPPFGFSTPGTRTWLPQPADWGRWTVAAQRLDPDSMLNLYRAALALRRGLPELGTEQFGWLHAPDGVLAFHRGGAFSCVVNFGPDPYPLDGERFRVALASAPVPGAVLPPDAAVWLLDRDGKAGDASHAAVA
jgi:alpha-glucosidase